jgi:hypothetical protein
MATIHNPTDFNLFCLALRYTVAAGETVTTSNEVARQVPGGVFMVKVDEASPTATPTRKTVTRGAQKVEVTKAPAVEMH